MPEKHSYPHPSEVPALWTSNEIHILLPNSSYAQGEEKTKQKTNASCWKTDASQRSLSARPGRLWKQQRSKIHLQTGGRELKEQEEHDWETPTSLPQVSCLGFHPYAAYQCSIPQHFQCIPSCLDLGADGELQAPDTEDPDMEAWINPAHLKLDCTFQVENFLRIPVHSGLEHQAF